MSKTRGVALGSALMLIAAAFLGSFWLSLHRPPHFTEASAFDLIWGAPFLAFPAVGAFILSRRPHNQIGRLLLGIGAVMALSLLLTETGRILSTSVSTSPYATAVFLIGDSLIKAGLAGVAVVLLLFPDGELPSERWRWILIAVIASAALGVVASLLSPGRVDEGHLAPSPLALSPALPLAGAIQGPAGLAIFGSILVACGVSVLMRYRAADETTRRRLKWVAWAVALFAVAEFVTNLLGLVGLPGWLNQALLVPPAAAGIAVAAAIAIAILRYQLFDINIVMSRTLAYGVMAGLIVVIYLVVVIGVGAAVGSRAGSNLILSIVATAMVAMIFQPVRTRLERAANRVVYGHRATPYELLSQFTRRTAGAYAGDDVIEHLAKVLGEGLLADAAAVRMSDSNGAVVLTCWPGPGPPDPPAEHEIAVGDQGEQLGALLVWRAEPFNQTEERLMDDLAAQAGHLLRKRGLTAELRRRLEDLRASRQRLVTSQDEERRRIERDLHDGAQQQLIAIGARLGIAEGRAVDDEQARLFAELKAEVASALDDLRSLGRGLYPPLLESQGLKAALTALARRASLKVELKVDQRRFEREVEGAVYFCVSEALQNAGRHSGASRVLIEVMGLGDRLDFTVRDDGHGFTAGGEAGAGIQNMVDRMEALGGQLQVSTGPEGTEVSGWSPFHE